MVRDRRPRSSQERGQRQAGRAFPGGAVGAVSNVGRTPTPPRGRVTELAVTAPMTPYPPPPVYPSNHFRVDGGKARAGIAGVMIARDVGVPVTEIEITLRRETASFCAGLLGIADAVNPGAIWAGIDGQPMHIGVFTTPNDSYVYHAGFSPYLDECVLRMTYDPSTGDWTLARDGVVQQTGVLTTDQRDSLSQPVWAGMRWVDGWQAVTFENFRVNGLLIDAFNRPDSLSLENGWRNWPW